MTISLIILLAVGRRVELHPISENRVFKARRRTIPAALPTLSMVPDVWFEQTTYRLQGDCTTAVLIRLASPKRLELLLHGFGDRRAAITLERNKLLVRPEESESPIQVS